MLRKLDMELSSNARVRVKYHVEYPIGFVFEPGTFAVAGDADGIGIGLRRPQLVARPSVKLQSARIIESGLTIDEQGALVKLQQRIQPEAERRAGLILRGQAIVPRSEAALRAFLVPFLATQAKGVKPPTIHIKYYK